jgi:hypothetical protein
MMLTSCDSKRSGSTWTSGITRMFFRRLPPLTKPDLRPPVRPAPGVARTNRSEPRALKLNVGVKGDVRTTHQVAAVD